MKSEKQIADAIIFTLITLSDKDGEDKPETTPGLTVCIFGVFSKLEVLTQLFCGLLPRPPNGAIGAMPDGEICQIKNEQKKFWFRFCKNQKNIFGLGFAKTEEEIITTLERCLVRFARKNW